MEAFTFSLSTQEEKQTITVRQDQSSLPREFQVNQDLELDPISKKVEEGTETYLLRYQVAIKYWRVYDTFFSIRAINK